MSGQVIRPGDTVLVRLDNLPSPEEQQRLTEALERELPGCRIVVLAGVAGIDVYRPGAEASEDEPT